MVTQTVLATLAVSTPDRRLQVLLIERRGGDLSFDLREQHYAEGIGWFDQRTLELEPCQLRQLQGILARGSADRVRAGVKAPATLPFPGKATRRPARRVASAPERREEIRPLRIFRGTVSHSPADCVEEGGATQRN